MLETDCRDVADLKTCVKLLTSSLIKVVKFASVLLEVLQRQFIKLQFLSLLSNWHGYADVICLRYKRRIPR